jgi:hypothetical protein
MNNMHKVLLRTAKGQRPPGKPSRRYEDNIKKYLKGILCEVADWVQVSGRACSERSDFVRDVEFRG